MLNKVLLSISVAWQNIKANPLHTLLSTLGIIIGVAALVTILSLADGMEKFAREQISRTSSLNAIIVQSETRKQIDSVWVNLDTFPVFRAEQVGLLQEEFSSLEHVLLTASGTTVYSVGDSEREVGGYLDAVEGEVRTLKEKFGDSEAFDRFMTEGVDGGVLINRGLAEKLVGKDRVDALIGSPIYFEGLEFRVEEIIETENHKQPLAITRITSLNQDLLRKDPPRLITVAYNIEEVPRLTEEIKTWLDQNFDEGSVAFQVITNKSRVDQARKGMLLFKLIMGLITGISVVVGGIGVMNVLLISITERTAEIGIRKATGAKRRDILLQFLSESVTVAGLGSTAGLILGMLVSLLAVPVIEHLIDVPFEAVFTFSTFMVIGILAFAIGIIFGTYPALRASRLTPIEAIGRE